MQTYLLTYLLTRPGTVLYGVTLWLCLSVRLRPRAQIVSPSSEWIRIIIQLRRRVPLQYHALHADYRVFNLNAPTAGYSLQWHKTTENLISQEFDIKY